MPRLPGLGTGERLCRFHGCSSSSYSHWPRVDYGFNPGTYRASRAVRFSRSGESGAKMRSHEVSNSIAHRGDAKPKDCALSAKSLARS